MTNDRPTAYRIFVLTFWPDDNNDPIDPETWRFRLEEPRSGWQQGCIGVNALTNHLTKAIRPHADALDKPPHV